MYARRVGVTTRTRALLWAAATLYTFGLYSEAQFYAHGLGMNPAERRARLGLACVMEAAVLALLAAEYRK